MPDDWSARLILGDCVEAMAALDAESVDAVICDPPYEIGFMGKAWDSSGVAYSTETWAAAARVLKPGGHLLAFGATRMYHRMAVAIEDAGFEIRDSLHWIYGSGFPKSLDVSKQIDKAAGAARETIGQRSVPDATKLRPHFAGISNDGDGSPTRSIPITVSATDEARQWEGWGTALKPSHEPIVMARKPLAGTVVETVLAHGTGALNIGDSRVGTSGGASAVPGTRGKSKGSTDFPGRAEMAPLDAGRWPANVLLAHLPECKGNGANHTDTLCAPGCPVAELNEASGVSVSQGVSQFAGRSIYGADAEGYSSRGREIGKGDSGGAARFFYIAKPRTRERVGGSMRNLHPTVKPIDLMRHLVRLVTPPGGVVLDPFLGSGTTGCAAMIEGARFIGIERDEDSFETSLARVSDYAFAHDRSKPTVG